MRTDIATLLETFPAERRADLEPVVRTLAEHVPAGYESATSKGMLVFQVPLADYPDTYNGQPLWYAALAAQKSYNSLYLMGAYGESPLTAKLADGFKAAGKKLDMGKSCVRFRKPDDLELGVIADVLAAIPPARWIEIAKQARTTTRKGKP